MTQRLLLVFIIVMIIPAFITPAFSVPSPGHAGKTGGTLKKIYATGKATFVQELEITPGDFPKNVTVQTFAWVLEWKNHIYIADTEAHDIKMLSASGKYIKTIGKRGSGNGELANPLYLVVNGDALMVWEKGNSRYSFFKPDGTFIKHIPVKQHPYRRFKLVDIKPLPDGRFILERHVHLIHSGIVDHRAYINIYSAELEKKSIFYRQGHERSPGGLLPNQYDYNLFRTLSIYSFQPEVSWDTLPGNRVVFGFPIEYALDIYDLKTGEVKTTFHPGKQEALTDADKKSFFDALVTRDSEHKPRLGLPKKEWQHLVLPQKKPFFKKIITDYEGNILVFIYKNSKSMKYAYFDAFDTNGKFIAQVRILPKPMDIQNAYFNKKTKTFWAITKKDPAKLHTAVVKYKMK